MSQPATVTAPDVRQLGQQTLPEISFPGGRQQAFRVFFEPNVHERIWKHSGEDVSVEICGVLVGKWARDAEGPFVLISEAIRGEKAANKFAEVTFTHETWGKIHAQMDSQFAHLAIVGWYHSHPDFGVFLSDRDRFIQEHFFSSPGHLAYVVDPIRKTEGVFIWREGKPTLAPHYWVGDRLQVATAAGQEDAGKPAARAAVPDAGTGKSPHDNSPLPSFLSQAAVGLALFLLGYLLAGRMTDVDRLRLEQSAFARAWLYLKLRPGLNEELSQIHSDLGTIDKKAKALAREHLKLVDDPKETAEEWSEVTGKLDDSFRRLRKIKTTYCLTPEEMMLLEALGEGRLKSLLDDKSKKDKKPEAAPDPAKPKAKEEKPAVPAPDK